MKRALVVVIDGLGVGSDSGHYNTLASIFAADHMTDIRSGTLNLLKGYLTNKLPTIMPSYSGADSYRGHFEMVGVQVTANQIYIEHHLNSISQLFSTYKVDEICTGGLSIGQDLYLSNNIETELGGAINCIVNLDQIDWNRAINYGERISALLSCQRVIVMGSHKIKKESIIRAITRRYDERSSRYINGIVPAKAGIYGKTYKAYHIGLPLMCYGQNNLITNLRKNSIEISLIGKVSDILQLKNISGIYNYQVNIAEDTGNLVVDMLKSKTGFIFVNFQTVDLQGHACNPLEAARELVKVCYQIDRIRAELNDDDMLIITSDHGNDPSVNSSTHTREYVPFQVLGHPTELRPEKGLSNVATIVEEYILQNKTERIA